MISKEEFEKGYAKRSHKTVQELHDLGLVAAPCSCGDWGCEGWKMTSEKS